MLILIYILRLPRVETRIISPFPINQSYYKRPCILDQKSKDILHT